MLCELGYYIGRIGISIEGVRTGFLVEKEGERSAGALKPASVSAPRAVAGVARKFENTEFKNAKFKFANFSPSDSESCSRQIVWLTFCPRWFAWRTHFLLPKPPGTQRRVMQTRNHINGWT